MKLNLVLALAVIGPLSPGESPAQKNASNRRMAPPASIKGFTPAASPLVPQSAGGPDGHGYVFRDSNEPGGPAFDWVEISATGVALGLVDDGEATVPLPFPFRFYGSVQTEARIGHNGALLLAGSGDVGFTNGCPLPSAADSAAPRLAVHWDDLYDSAGNVYHQAFAACPAGSEASGACFVVEWHQRPHFDDPAGGGASFEAVLYENGDVLYQYLDTAFGDPAIDAGASASVGIEHEAADPSFFLAYSCNQAGSLPDGLAILWTIPPVAAAGAVPLAESCANGAIDPGESVTVELCVEANAPVAALVGTLAPGGGVVSPGEPQSYGAISPGDPPVCRPFSFVAASTLACGGELVATLELEEDGAALGSVRFPIATGALASETGGFSNPGALVLPAEGTAAPYPSTISVSGMPGRIVDLRVTLHGFGHTFPDETGFALVGPGGAALAFMDGPNGGTDAAGLELTLADGAATQLPVSGALTSGTFRPMAEYDDLFPAPAPPSIADAAPAGGATFVSQFGGTAPDGDWSLFAADFVAGDGGVVNGGWTLEITSGARVCCTVAASVLEIPAASPGAQALLALLLAGAAVLWLRRHG
jgi:hypothetical protein